MYKAIRSYFHHLSGTVKVIQTNSVVYVFWSSLIRAQQWRHDNKSRDLDGNVISHGVELKNVTLDHKTSDKCQFFWNWDLYIIWKLNK